MTYYCVMEINTNRIRYKGESLDTAALCLTRKTCYGTGKSEAEAVSDARFMADRFKTLKPDRRITRFCLKCGRELAKYDAAQFLCQDCNRRNAKKYGRALYLG